MPWVPMVQSRYEEASSKSVRSDIDIIQKRIRFYPPKAMDPWSEQADRSGEEDGIREKGSHLFARGREGRGENSTARAPCAKAAHRAHRMSPLRTPENTG
jgi:hypothetical protein